MRNDRAAGGPADPRGYPGNDSDSTGRIGRPIGLATPIAADLLPEAGDSRAVDGGEAI
jgi:hypothetical protein